jgi:hypothetical protein
MSTGVSYPDADPPGSAAATRPDSEWVEVSRRVVVVVVGIARRVINTVVARGVFIYWKARCVCVCVYAAEGVKELEDMEAGRKWRW